MKSIPISFAPALQRRRREHDVAVDDVEGSGRAGHGDAGHTILGLTEVERERTARIREVESDDRPAGQRLYSGLGHGEREIVAECGDAPCAILGETLRHARTRRVVRGGVLDRIETMAAAITITAGFMAAMISGCTTLS